MDKLEMLTKVEKYYESEIRDVKRVLDTFDNEKVINGVIQRCLGVAFFVQEFDIPYIPYNEVNDLYENVRKELTELLKGV